MIQQIVLQQFINTQKRKIFRLSPCFEREILTQIPIFQSQVFSVTSIRRCGKSTLLKQMVATYNSRKLFLSFEDLLLFDLSDFEILDNKMRDC